MISVILEGFDHVNDAIEDDGRGEEGLGRNDGLGSGGKGAKDSTSHPRQ